MAQNYGVTRDEMRVPNFVGDHPALMQGVTLASSGSVRELLAGTVLGKITASGKYAPWAHDATNGSQTARRILVEDVTVPASGDEIAATYRHGEFLRDGLTWDQTAEAADVLAAIDALEGVGIYVK